MKVVKRHSIIATCGVSHFFVQSLMEYPERRTGESWGQVVLFHSIVQIKWSTAEFVMNCAHRVHLRELQSGIETMQMCCTLPGL